MRFLLDTNILIPLEDSMAVLQPSLTNFIRLSTNNAHELLFHPASLRDIARDKNDERREQTTARINRYSELVNPPKCPWNTQNTHENDAVDNEILFALERHCCSALVTEDLGIHKKALERGLSDRVYFIQTAEDLLNRLHSEHPVQLPNIKDVNLYEIDVTNPFFESLREGYEGFNVWYSRKSADGTKAWLYGDNAESPQAICIYDIQANEQITDKGQILNGEALKLCTFKVDEAVRGRKIGELFLKAAFRYASDNQIENIFITAKSDEQPFLISLLQDFGFSCVGDFNGDSVFVKNHPLLPPENEELAPFDYLRRYFPHFIHDESVNKFLVPIQPAYHDILFPDCVIPQANLFDEPLSTVGNAIKLAYLSHAQQSQIQEGDILLFYRSNDLMAVTSIGIVERFEISNDTDEIAGIVSRRTVYNMNQIRNMAEKTTKVILFRLISHLPQRVPYNWMRANEIVNGHIQSTSRIGNDEFARIIEYSQSGNTAVD